MSKVDKKLAAIMFTDIVGYTQQMSEDEDKAFALIKKKRDLLLPLIEKHEGKLIKEIGDGTLTRYFKPDDAIDCASRFQSKTDDDLNVRVGIHTGEVIIDNEDVFGDVVNVASRLESIAVPGSVLVSKETIDKLEMSKDFELVSLGMQSLKGVGRLIEVFAIKEDSLVIPKSSDFKDTKVDIHDSDEVPAIAIIPFENKGADEDVFYAYGISADLISGCSSAGLIRVASLKDVEKLDFDNMDTSEISKKLLVRYIAQGTLWKMGKMFQLSIELFDAKDKKVVWSDRWQEKWDNLPTIKNKLSDGLLKALNTNHGMDEKVQTYDSIAYEYYLKAKNNFEKRETKKDLLQLITILKKAIELDSNLIEARLLLGSAYYAKSDIDNAIKVYELARGNAEYLNNNSGLALCLDCLGDCQSFKGNYDTAMKYFQSSLSIKKKMNDKNGIAFSHINIGKVMTENRQFSDALDNYEKAKKVISELDDKIGLASIFSSIGRLYFYMSDPKHAIFYLKESFNIYSDINYFAAKAECLTYIATCYSAMGDNDKALKYFNESYLLINELGNKSMLAFIYRNMGNIYFTKFDIGKSISMFDKSLNIARSLGAKSAIAHTLVEYGLVNAFMADYEEAIKSYEESLIFFENQKNNHAVSNLLTNIGYVYLFRSEYEKSIKCFKRSLIMLKKLKMENSFLGINTQLAKSLALKHLNLDFDRNLFSTLAKDIENLDYAQNLMGFDLTGNNSYIINANDQIQEIISNIDDNLRNEFISYPIPKRILEEYKKL